MRFSMLLGFIAVFATVGAVAMAPADRLDVAIYEIADDEGASCLMGRTVAGRASDEAETVVRSGPGREFRSIDVIAGIEPVLLFEQRGDWIGVLYATEKVDCEPTNENRVLSYTGKKGWIHRADLRVDTNHHF